MQRSQLVINKTEVIADEGCVVAEHPLAAEVGAKALADGGNAVDAAVAMAFALGVVEPMMSGIGGGGFMLIHLAKQRKNVGIEFLPRVPMAARPDMYELDPERQAAGIFGWPGVKEDANSVGYLSVGVPGAVAGLSEAQRRYGAKSLAWTLEPAIGLANEGFIVDWYIAALTGASMDRLRRFPETAAIFLPNDAPPLTPVRTYTPVEPLRQPELGRTLSRLAKRGPEEFYRGETARAIVADMTANGGLLSMEDLASYQPTHYDEVLEGSYRGYTIVATPRTTAGPTIVEMLNILEGFSLEQLGSLSAAALHRMAEAQRLAFVDRFTYIADPAFADVPFGGLVSKAYAEERRREILPDKATPGNGPGDPWRFEPGATRRTPGQGAGVSADPAFTTHLCVVDRDRNMVSLMNTIGDLWGSYATSPGTGVLLNDAMVWFNPVPGQVNSVAPGKTPVSNLTALLALKDGQPLLTIGAPGGRKVITGVLQSVINFIDHGQSLQDAIAAPRVHCEGETVQVDSRISPAVRAELEAMGHKLQVLDETHIMANFARPVGIAVDPTTGKLRSGVDVLRPAAAVGF